MKILVTGAAGYIGQSACNALLEAGHTVIAVDPLIHGLGYDPLLTRTGFQAHDCDVELMCRAPCLKDIDVILNLAGLSSEALCAKRPDEAYRVNAGLPVLLFEAAQRAGVKLFIQASTASVYGAQKYGTTPGIVGPLETYGVSKLMAETGLESLAKLSGNRTKLIVLRQGTVGGTAYRMRWDLLINTMFMRAKEYGEVLMDVPDLAWRPIVHLPDLVRVYVALVSRYLPGGRLAAFTDARWPLSFDVASDNVDLLSLGAYVAAELGVPVRRVAPERPVDQIRTYKCDTLRIWSHLELGATTRSEVRTLADLKSLAFPNFHRNAYYNIHAFGGGFSEP